MISSRIALLNLIFAFFRSARISMYLFLRRTIKKTMSLPWSTMAKHLSNTIQVVKRLRGDGATLVLCMFLINFAKPNFHSMSD